MTRAVVMFSGGVGSWMAARRTVARYGSDAVTLLFADTLIEDPDLYRFIEEAAADVGAPLVRVADGRTPWEVFKAERMLGNTRMAPCSKLLKQRPCRRWMADNAPNAVVVLGIDWTEEHRVAGAAAGWAPWAVEAPLCEAPYLTKRQMIADLEAKGIRRPALYAEGFPHNNCGGGCVRAGAAHFAHLYRQRPATFAEWEAGEAGMREYLDADVAILRDRRGGETVPLTLAALRERLERQPALFEGAEGDWGGCGCMVAPPRPRRASGRRGHTRGAPPMTDHAVWSLMPTDDGDLIDGDGRHYAVAAVDRLAALEAVAEAAEAVSEAPDEYAEGKLMVALDAALARLWALDAGGEA